MKKLNKKSSVSFNSVETYAAKASCTCTCSNCQPKSFLYDGAVLGSAILYG
ncbi:hypothetical protein [Paenibacillus sonchi]|uniref:hypothetical protein n=1 Tax=Paenibacillus sonchi TaxID=373687 RepID=UPI000FA8E4EC|nr:hypothetical protein [Paenibacillus sonchi]MCE3200483.1 hypothetical protein [Paenibacillus sonchi]